MSAIKTFAYKQVDTIPQLLEPGIVYHAPKFYIASHLCACGCGYEAVTGLRPGHWSLSIQDGRPTIMPSIGNNSFPCRSHYFIRNGFVRWAGTCTDEMILFARERDNPRMRRRPQSAVRRLVSQLLRWFGIGGD
jgi:hypothetical protein